MKNSKLVLMLAFVASFAGLQADRDLTPSEKQAIQNACSIAANTTALAVYSTQIGIAQATETTAQLTGCKNIENQAKDRVKRLQFCLWETRNFVNEVTRAVTDEERNVVAAKFAEQMSVCGKLVTSAW